MFDKFLATAKAWAALLGAVITAVVAVNPTTVPSWVAYVTAALTAIAVYGVPNTERGDHEA
jgi:hypothetical protein